MGHNVSNRKRLSTVMGSRITDFVDWTLVIRCPRCRETTDIRVQELLELHGARKVSDVVTKLRCSRPRCGSRLDQVILRNRLHEVTLTGPGGAVATCVEIA